MQTKHSEPEKPTVSENIEEELAWVWNLVNV